MDQTLIALKVVHFTAVCMCGANHSSMFIAVGRYNALIHPLKYSSTFTWRRTMLFIGIAWCTAIGHHFLSFFPGCYYYFDFRHYTWFHADSLCGEFLSWFVDMCYGVVMILLIGGTDVATFYQLYKAKKQSAILSASERLSKKRRRQEWRFFVQAFLSSGIIMLIFFTFHCVKKSMAMRFIHFISGCVCVILVHGTNGIILLIFNRELRYAVLRPFYRRPLRDMEESSTSRRPHSATVSSHSGHKKPSLTSSLQASTRDSTLLTVPNLHKRSSAE